MIYIIENACLLEKETFLKFGEEHFDLMEMFSLLESQGSTDFYSEITTRSIKYGYRIFLCMSEHPTIQFVCFSKTVSDNYGKYIEPKKLPIVNIIDIETTIKKNNKITVIGSTSQLIPSGYTYIKGKPNYYFDTENISRTFRIAIFLDKQKTIYETIT